MSEFVFKITGKLTYYDVQDKTKTLTHSASGSGTCFLLHPLQHPGINERVFVTNRHIFENVESRRIIQEGKEMASNESSDEFVVHFPGARQFPVNKKEFVVDENYIRSHPVKASYDVALFHVDISNDELSEVIASDGGLELTETVKIPGIEAHVCGFPAPYDQGIIPFQTYGSVAQDFVLNVSVSSGNSGGPVLHNSKVIGIVAQSIVSSRGVALCVSPLQTRLARGVPLSTRITPLE